MNLFDVRIHAIRRRRNRRRPFEVRWHAAGRGRSKSFITRRLADSYRAELVRAARRGLEFDPITGEPVLWAAPEPDTGPRWCGPSAAGMRFWHSARRIPVLILVRSIWLTPSEIRPGRDPAGRRQCRDRVLPGGIGVQQSKSLSDVARQERRRHPVHLQYTG